MPDTISVIGNQTSAIAAAFGIVRPGNCRWIGNGAVVDPWHSLKEIDPARAGSQSARIIWLVAESAASAAACET